MKGDSGVITHLNTILGQTLSAINQSFLHARMYKNWGLTGLDEHEYKLSIQKMKDADGLIERILFLEGLPNLQNIAPLRIGEETIEMIESDFGLETTIRKLIQEAINHCESISDFVTREQLDEILQDVEESIDWAETQLSLIKQIGIENYQQSKM
jgi:bacterioferritin